jgi:hypothetical protein
MSMLQYLTLPYLSSPGKRHESVAMSNASNYPFLWNTKVFGVLIKYKPVAFTTCGPLGYDTVQSGSKVFHRNEKLTLR